MSISVIIPLYNKEASVARAIQSVLDQTVAAADIIVVDDESNDDSADIAKSFGTRITLLQQKNAGPSAARNRGAQVATGDHLLFLDGDDELLPNALEKHLACFDRDRDISLSLGSFRHFFTNGLSYSTVIADRIDPSENEFAYVTRFTTNTVINIPSGAICVTRRLFDSIGKWDENLRCWEVTDFLLRASLDSEKTCLHRALMINVHQTCNSLFAETRSNEQYNLRFATKIIARLDKMAERERSMMLLQVRNIAYDFWLNSKFDALRRLSIEVWKKAFGKDAMHLFFCLGLLPAPLLALAHRLRHPRTSL